MYVCNAMNTYCFCPVFKIVRISYKFVKKKKKTRTNLSKQPNNYENQTKFCLNLLVFT